MTTNRFSGILYSAMFEKTGVTVFVEDGLIKMITVIEEVYYIDMDAIVAIKVI